MISPEVGPEILLEPVVARELGPAVVAIGGGHGLAQALRAISTYAGRITAVVTVADDGGSSGRLAPDLQIPPPGDIRQCLIALTAEDSVWRRLFDYRFEGADVQGHSLGNLIIASLADLEGDFETALRAAERLLGSVGSVVPASPQRLHLEATIDGAAVRGQVAIARSRGAVEALRVVPKAAEASQSAVAAIEDADQIVLGPGSLYTSIMAALVVPGISEAVNRSQARLVFVSNLSTQDGETLGMDCADHLDTLLELTGVRPPGAVVANESEVNVSPPLEPVVAEPEVLATYGADTEFAHLLDPDVEWPRHDPAPLGGVLKRLVSTEPA